MSKRSSRVLALVVAFLALASGCAGQRHRAEFSAGYPVYDCPEHLQGRVGLSVEARPISIDAVKVKEQSIATTGAVGRRLLVSVTSAERPADRVIWSALNILSYGGTFLGWSRLQTDNLILAPSADVVLQKQTNSREQAQIEIAAVSIGPGGANVVRSMRGKSNLLGVSSLDVLIMPGGAVVDDTVLRIPNLWMPDGRPVPPDKVAVEMIPVRHPPGLDTVEASVELAYIVRESKSGDEWHCSAEGRATLVDHDSVRQPFWDLGLVGKNRERGEWLVLLEPSLGAVRTVFDSPASANALASWIQTTAATQIGEYQFGVVRQSAYRKARPYGPVDADAMTTFRALSANDLPAIKVGAVGEP
jgi:hypothetical protein